jgi:hypothetical protein
MGSVVSESLGRVKVLSEANSKADEASAPLGALELRALARAIIDKEPSEIRGLLSQDPDMVRGWVAQLKTQQLQAAGTVGVWHDALDHIRLSTLSPLKFAAE